jgi:hypothetical protein
MKPKKPEPPPVGESKLPQHPKPSDPAHDEWVIDEAEDESFPASDPSSPAQPHRLRKKKVP